MACASFQNEKHCRLTKKPGNRAKRPGNSDRRPAFRHFDTFWPAVSPKSDLDFLFLEFYRLLFVRQRLGSGRLARRGWGWAFLLGISHPFLGLFGLFHGRFATGSSHFRGQLHTSLTSILVGLLGKDSWIPGTGALVMGRVVVFLGILTVRTSFRLVVHVVWWLL